MPHAPDADATGAYRPEFNPPPPAERFAPGTLLAERYRVVAPLGNGGMGEVYRADDLILGQPVALKFLPAHVAADPDRLTRFRKEVAAARKISHPHVCRVYDIADHDGQPFLTMEFVDGEDLASVLKRLGRVSEEKGIEIARQLCGALAAVHDQGLLHRDLKPANVMLDGRGKVRLTDFGLAAAAADLSVSEVRSGTPLYQAPEQIAGREVTARSDLYALGLLLYELFTGKRAFADAGRDAPPGKPSSHVSGLNPAVERVILRCLEADPANRPRSAVEALAGLPGGDPLAAALAAGETPSPQLVADTGEVGLIRPWVGAALLAFVVIGLAALAVLNDRFLVFPHTRLTASPADQERAARELLARCGLPDRPAETVSGYTHAFEVMNRVQERDPAPDRFRFLAGGRTHSTFFYYRQTPVMWLDGRGGYVNDDLPPLEICGEGRVRLDGRGRLLELVVVPPRELPEAAAGDWAGPLLAAAKLDLGDTVTADVPKWTPPVYVDAVQAWVIRTADGQILRAEAGAVRGRAVWFHLSDERERPTPGAEGPPTAWWLTAFGVGILTALLVFAARNVRRGRVDRRGAGVAGAASGISTLAAWVFGGHHPASFYNTEFSLMPALGVAVFIALFTAAVYVAFEPAVRRRWPWRLTAWSRLVAGRVRDPLVGRDVLAGAAAAVAFVLVFALFHWAGTALDLPGRPFHSPGDEDGGGRRVFPGVGFAVGLSAARGMNIAFSTILVAFLFGLVLRREWLVWPAFALLTAVVWQPSTGYDVARNLCAAGVLVFAYARFGLLAGCAFGFVVEMWVRMPPTADPQAWHFGQGLTGVVVILALAGYGCYTATGGRLFKEGFLGDD